MERQELKLVFSEIVEGYSLTRSELFGDLKIKHINNYDSAKTDIKNNYWYEKSTEYLIYSKHLDFFLLIPCNH